ncbi:MAG: hypothetical protein ACR2L4_07865 [Actinomycetota bacterium]
MAREDAAENRFDWAFRWALRQSFGPWAYHHGPGTDEADWCDECRATWQLAQEIAAIENPLPWERPDA